MLKSKDTMSTIECSISLITVSCTQNKIDSWKFTLSLTFMEIVTGMDIT